MTSNETHPSDLAIAPGAALAEPGPAAIAAAVADAQPVAQPTFRLGITVHTAVGSFTWVVDSEPFMADDYEDRKADAMKEQRDTGMITWPMLPTMTRLFNVTHALWIDFEMIPVADVTS